MAAPGNDRNSEKIVDFTPHETYQLVDVVVKLKVLRVRDRFKFAVQLNLSISGPIFS